MVVEKKPMMLVSSTQSFHLKHCAEGPCLYLDIQYFGWITLPEELFAVDQYSQRQGNDNNVEVRLSEIM